MHLGSRTAGFRVPPHTLRPRAPTFAWVVLSHFGGLTTVVDCHDPELLTRILAVLEDFGLKYIPNDYLGGG